jgi:hypothetical protein
VSIAKRLLLAGTSVIVFLVCAFIILVFAESTGMVPPDLPEWSVPLFLLALCALPLAGGVAVVRVLRPKWLARAEGRTGPSPWTRIVIRAGVAAYILTAVFGAPAVQSDQTTWAVTEYKRLKASGSKRVWDAHPYIRTYAAIPVVPGVILSYHEYQLDGLYGFGGFELTLWYAVGTRPIADFPLWLS